MFIQKLGTYNYFQISIVSQFIPPTVALINCKLCLRDVTRFGSIEPLSLARHVFAFLIAVSCCSSGLLDSIWLFRSLTPEQRNELSRKVTPVFFKEGDILARPGEPSPLYIVCEGEVRVYEKPAKERMKEALERCRQPQP